jgi:uncharacterized membrane protein (UPF0127 family)
MMRVFRRQLFVLALVAAIAPLTACKNNGQPAPTTGTPATRATVTIDTGERKVSFRVELALTPAEQERGLMFREALGADEGMLFVFDRESVHTFWMKNTLIPLDMLFIDKDRRIVGIVENAEPKTLTGRSVGIPSQYVLEIAGGFSGNFRIRPGHVVEFQGVPTP